MTGDCVQIIETKDKDDAATRMKMDSHTTVAENNDGGRDHSEDENKHEATIHADE